MNEYKTDIVRDYKPLTKEAQQSLYTKMRRGNTNARDQLIGSCLPLVIDIARKFAINNKHIDLEDLIQEGNVALMKAVDNWDSSKAVLSTLATHYVKRSLINMIYDSSYHIKTSRHLTRNAARQLYQIKRTNLTDPVEISQETGIPEKTVMRLLFFSRENRYRKQRGGRADGSRNNSLIENIATGEEDKNTVCFQDIVELSKKVLTKTEQELLFDRYGINGVPFSLKMLSKKFDQTIQNVDKTLTAIKGKIREATLEKDDAEILHI